MDLPEAARRFVKAMSYCDDVVTVHRAAGGQGRGRRVAETSLNRSVIVMAVAGWQTAVENMVLSALDAANAHASMNPSVTLSSYSNTVRASVERFSTPSAEKARELFRSVGYDPQLHWTAYRVPGRQRAGTLQQQLNAWIKVRHAIAHGDDSLPRVDVLQAVRQNSVGAPVLRLTDAESCVRFVRRIAEFTGGDFAHVMGLGPVSWIP